MSFIDHFIPFHMIDDEDNTTIGNLRFIRDKLELDLYDKDHNKILKENLKNLKFEKNSLVNKEIILSYNDKKICIPKEKDQESKKLFFLIQTSLFNLYESPPELNPHYKNKIIKKPTDYQEEIFNKAKNSNSIIFLETGLGKTYIAIMLLKDLFGENLYNNYYNRVPYVKNTTKKALFLFKTVSLLLQQSKVLKYNTNLKIIKFYGGGDSSMPSLDKFRGIVNRYDVICSTPEVIYKYFTLGFLNSEDLELIIVDECHHTKKSDFLNMILKHFIFEIIPENTNGIRIIGLTASPSDDANYDQKSIRENIQDLCNNLRSKLICSKKLIAEVNDLKITEKNFQILPLENSTEETPQKKIKEFFIKELILDENLIKYFENKYKLTKNGLLSQIARLIFSLFCKEEKQNENANGIFDLENLSNFIKFEDSIIKSLDLIDKKENFENFIKYLQSEDNSNSIKFEYDSKVAEKSLKNDIISIEIIKFIKTLNLIIKYTDSSVIKGFSETLIQNLMDKIKNKNEFITNFINEFIIKLRDFFSQNKEFVKFKSEYLLTLENFFLKKIIDGKINSNKTIIFLNKRIITKYLSETINNFLKQHNFYSTFVVGCAKQGNLFNEEELKKNINAFETDTKCIGLFATNVVEEGIDIPLCDNIINLSEIISMRELIQKSGRARKSNSTIYTCSVAEENKIHKTKENIDKIKYSIEIMKNIIMEDTIAPKFSNNREFLENIDYYQTKGGARVYLSYAKNIVNHFIGKLFNDGFTFIKAEMKIEEIVENKTKIYRPYLSLPNCLEENFTKIYDNSINFFKQEDATTYGNAYENYYYLKAVKFLHKHSYLDDNLCFVKNYDDLIHLDFTYAEYKNEPKVSLKQNIKKISDEESTEYYLNYIDYDPMYMDLNIKLRYDTMSSGNSYDGCEFKKLCLISEMKLADLDFNVFVPSTQLLLMYWINSSVIEDFDFELLNMPKINYNYFSQINFKISNSQKIKLKKEEKLLIDFYYSYSLFFSTDSELTFYYLLLNNKFTFSYIFLDDLKIKKKLNKIFEKVNLIIDENAHFANLKTMQNLDYHHLIKISIIKGNVNTGFIVDFEEINNTLQTVKEDITNYYNFLRNYIETDQQKIENYLSNIQSMDEYIDELNPSIDQDKTKKFSRNFLNFSKIYVCNYSEKVKRGSLLINSSNNGTQKKYFYKKKHSDDETYQMDYLKSYGLLSSGTSDYLKTYVFDFNQRMLKYKLNMKNLGRVYKKSKQFFIKKFRFLPKECVYEIKNTSIDKIFIFGMIPTILFKLQHNLIYYYQSKMLKDRFSSSFGVLKDFKMNLIIEALNSKSTMESQNYERLEFLGDSVLKFLSSLETFLKNPNSNRDLLFSKRRIIESNKNLFLKAIHENNKLDEYLYTTPINFKRMNIKGFSNEEIFIFNIGMNRSFAKKILSSRVKNDENENKNNNKNIIDSNSKNYEEENEKIKENALENNPEDEESNLIMLKEQENLESDKTLMNLAHFENTESENEDENNTNLNDFLHDRNYIGVEKLEEFVLDNIETIPGDHKPSRIISNKVLADFTESLTGYLFYMNYKLFLKNETNNFFELPSDFLKDIGILEDKINIENIQPFWLKDLSNLNCKFENEQKINRFACINNEKYHKFRKIELLYQAVTHPEYINQFNYNYVNKSYQRLAFLGEAFVSFCVAFYVYDNNPDVNECMLHKLKICGINHHIISSLAIKMNLHDMLMINGKEIKEALDKYVNNMRNFSYENYLDSLKNPEEQNGLIIDGIMPLDESFVIILCECFHAWVGAVLLDTQSIRNTYFILMGIMKDSLKKFASKENFIEHPKVIILDNFERRKEIFKRIKENGSNRIDMKKESKSIRDCKLYEYQLIIDKYIIYEEFIFFNRSTIRIAQEKAKNVFLKICDEVDKRLKYGLNKNMLELEKILKTLNIPIRKIKY